MGGDSKTLLSKREWQPPRAAKANRGGGYPRIWAFGWAIIEIHFEIHLPSDAHGMTVLLGFRGG